MKYACAWYRTDFQSTDGSEDFSGDVSHGICPRCSDNLEFQKGVSVSRFVEDLPYPIYFTITGQASSVPNKLARQQMRRPQSNLHTRCDKQVFECAEARLPEGCQRQFQCLGCVIRGAVATTSATGEPQLQVPAALMPSDPDLPSSVALRVSTLKIDPIVYLRLELISQEPVHP